MSRTTADTRTALYRIFGSDGELLYVGISNDPWRRQGEHMRKKHWYPQMGSFTVRMYEDWESARAAERRAIKDERPVWNIADAVAPIPPRFIVRQWHTLIALIVCGSISSAAVIANAFEPSWHSWLEPVSYPFFLAWPLALIAVHLAWHASFVKRIGIWLERHIEPYGHSRTDSV